MDPESSKARQKVLSALRGSEGVSEAWGGGQYHLQQGSHVGMAVSELDLDKNMGPAQMEMAGGHARRTNKLKPRHKWGTRVGLVKAADHP